MATKRPKVKTVKIKKKIPPDLEGENAVLVEGEYIIAIDLEVEKLKAEVYYSDVTVIVSLMLSPVTDDALMPIPVGDAEVKVKGAIINKGKFPLITTITVPFDIDHYEDDDYELKTHVEIKWTTSIQQEVQPVLSWGRPVKC